MIGFVCACLVLATATVRAGPSGEAVLRPRQAAAINTAEATHYVVGLRVTAAILMTLIGLNSQVWVLAESHLLKRMPSALSRSPLSTSARRVQTPI
jgi:hypothetical protein